MSDDLLKRLSEKPFERWALDRIEALEAALREIIAGYDWCMANQSNHIMPSIICEAIQDARAALDKDATK